MDNKNLANDYGTLSQTINQLAKAGYTHDFNLQGECLICHQSNISLSPDDFQIDKVYRFEGATDPEDESILFAISSNRYNIRGTLVNGYGISASSISAKMVEKLSFNPSYNPARPGHKSNEATTLRPTGDRTLCAPMVEMDLMAHINTIKSESTWATADRNSITVFKSHTMRVVLIGLHENAEIKPHKAHGVISVQVLEGQIEFEADGKSTQLDVGQMLVLNPNITHSVKAIKESVFLLTLAMGQR